MIRKLSISFAVTLVLALSTTLALAASPSQQECEAAGGTYDRDGGTVSCTFTTTENVGNSPNSSTTTSTETDSSNGTLNNDPKFEEDDSCAGPGKSTSSSHCP